MSPLSQRVGRQLRLLLNFLRFVWRYRFLRRTVAPTDPELTVLIVSLSDWVSRVKLELMVCKSLQESGATVTVLTYRSARWARLYYRFLGVRDFLFIDELLEQTVDAENDDRQAAAMLAERPTFAELLALTIDGLELGAYVLSSAVRELKHSGLSFDDPAVTERLRRGIATSLHTVRAGRQLFDGRRFHTMLFSEKGYTPYAELFTLALTHCNNIVQWTTGQEGTSFVLTRYTEANRNVHPFSLSAESWRRVRAAPWTPADGEAVVAMLRESYERGTWFNRKFLLKGKRSAPPEELKQELKLADDRPVAVIYSHVLWDATFFYGKNLFPDYEQWLIETVRVASENPAVQWIVKVHPDYAWKMRETDGTVAEPTDVAALRQHIGDLPDHVHLVLPDTPYNTYSFFQITDYCVTVRGTVGIEAPCFGIPVFTAGTGRYDGLGFTIDSLTREQYRERMRHIHTYPRLNAEQIELARRHADAVFRRRPLSFDTFRYQSNFRHVGSPLDKEITLSVRSAAEFAAAADIRRFADWVLRERSEDYLALPE